MGGRDALARVTELIDRELAAEADTAALPPLDAYSDEPLAREDLLVNGCAIPLVVRKPRQLRGVDFAEMHAHLTDGYVIKGIIGTNSLVGIIGPTASGKSFFAGDLAAHIASGMPWRGRRVRRGLVIFAALEGPVSAERRFLACRTQGDFSPGSPLRLTPGPINLRNPEDVALLVEFVRRAESDTGEKCVAIFIDTLSRAMAGGDENGPEDMGALIRGADALRVATGAAVLLVHHLGKDEARGARGHSSFKAALDTEIEVIAQGDTRVATVTKQRDSPAGTRFAFRLATVELGMDDEQEPVTTCIVEPAELAADRRQPSGKNQSALLSALQAWRRDHQDTDTIGRAELREMAEAQRVPQKRLAEAVEGLKKLGWLREATGGFRFLPDGGE